MDETRWLRWLRKVTREQSMRGIGRAVGVSHTTIRTWAKRGVPVERAWGITVRFRGDPIELLVMLGRVTPAQVEALNYAAIAEYMPTEVLSAELHRRVLEAHRLYPDITMQRRLS